MTLALIQVVLFISLALFVNPPTTANYHNYLTGTGAEILDNSVGTLEMIDGNRFMSDPNGRLTITVSYGDLKPGILGIAMRGLRTCRIVINHVMNPETSVTYDEKDLRSVLIHEIGHCFGLDHHKDEKHVMFWSYDGTPHSFEQIKRLVKDIRKMRGAD